jgi:hypothetical protein
MAVIDVILEGKLLASYPVALGWINAAPSERGQYIQEARRCALEDGLLTEENSGEAEFLVRDTG